MESTIRRKPKVKISPSREQGNKKKRNRKANKQARISRRKNRG